MAIRSDRSYDYIIVGGGAAGCVLAARLSEDPGISVLLLEAGPTDWDPRLRAPLGEILTIGSRYDGNFQSEPEPMLGMQTLSVPRGKVLGGSTSINGKLYVRGNRLDFDGWESQGNAGWGYKDLLPYFKKSENWEAGESAERGGAGPIQTAFGRFDDDIFHAFIEAGKELGHAENQDYNAGVQDGFAWSQYTHTHKSVARCSAARGYLHPNRRRRNLTILTNARVLKLIIEGKTCIGLRLLHDDEERVFAADREVILSAGTYQSPQLLMLSGIGDPQQLKEAGITALQELPGVGRNLQDHFGSFLQHDSRDTKTYYRLKNPLFVAKELARFAIFKNGPLSVFPMNAMAFVKSEPSLAKPDLQFYAYPLSANALSANDQWPHKHSIGIHWCVLDPQSRGQVSLHSGNPLAPPRIVHNYLAAEQDRVKQRFALRFARELFATQALRKHVGAESEPGAACTQDHEIDSYMQDFSAPHYHPVGTCKMGNDENAVVDASLRVHGIKGLRVVDASIMPEIVSGNTMAPTIAIAERAADLIRNIRQA